MKCAKCKARTRVADSRLTEFEVRRRRECIGCGDRFTTFERYPFDDGAKQRQQREMYRQARRALWALDSLLARLLGDD